jgi:hypothetical protein
MPIMVTKQDPQSFGSAITYCRRYALAAMVGVCPADDDAEAAMQTVRKPAVNTIGKAQIEEIESSLQGRPALREKLLDWAGIDHISDLPAVKYNGAMKAIENHISKEGAA